MHGINTARTRNVSVSTAIVTMKESCWSVPVMSREGGGETERQRERERKEREREREREKERACVFVCVCVWVLIIITMLQRQAVSIGRSLIWPSSAHLRVTGAHQGTQLPLVLWREGWFDCQRWWCLVIHHFTYLRVTGACQGTQRPWWLLQTWWCDQSWTARTYVRDIVTLRLRLT